MPAKVAKRRYKSRPYDSIPRSINFDSAHDAMLLRLSQGRVSPFIRRLVAMEYGRLQALGQLPPEYPAAKDEGDVEK